jgi:Spy/CpxP family protein refolding chaperone
MKKIVPLMMLSAALCAGSAFAQQQSPQQGQKAPAQVERSTGGKTGGGMGGMHRDKGRMAGAGIGHILSNRQQLKLNPDQVNKLEKLRADSMKDAVKRQADIKTAMIDMSSSMKQTPPDFNAIKSQMKKISDMKLAAKNAMVDTYEKAYNMLTKEQQAMLPTLSPAGGMCPMCGDEVE